MSIGCNQLVYSDTVCTQCEKRYPQAGYKMCDHCRELSKLSSKARADRNRAAGLCRCGRERMPGRKQCEKCVLRGREDSNKRAQKNRDQGLCACGRPLDSDKLTCSVCWGRQVNADKSRVQKLKELGLCNVCGLVPPRKGRTLCKGCAAKQNTASSKNKKELKQLVFEKYGGFVCNCCGKDDPRVMQIDHINGDGAAHRKLLANGNKSGGGGHTLYKWLRDNNFPPGYQVLCCECNILKGTGKECPCGAERRVMLQTLASFQLLY